MKCVFNRSWFENNTDWFNGKNEKINFDAKWVTGHDDYLINNSDFNGLECIYSKKLFEKIFN